MTKGVVRGGHEGLGPSHSGSIGGPLEFGTSYVKITDIHGQGYATQ